MQNAEDIKQLTEEEENFAARYRVYTESLSDPENDHSSAKIIPKTTELSLDSERAVVYLVQDYYRGLSDLEDAAREVLKDVQTNGKDTEALTNDIEYENFQRGIEAFAKILAKRIASNTPISEPLREELGFVDPTLENIDYAPA